MATYARAAQGRGTGWHGTGREMGLVGDARARARPSEKWLVEKISKRYRIDIFSITHFSLGCTGHRTSDRQPRIRRKPRLTGSLRKPTPSLWLFRDQRAKKFTPGTPIVTDTGQQYCNLGGLRCSGRAGSTDCPPSPTHSAVGLAKGRLIAVRCSAHRSEDRGGGGATLALLETGGERALHGT